MKLRTKLTVFSILLLAIAIALCCAIIISFAYQGEVESITSAGISDFDSQNVCFMTAGKNRGM